MRTGGLFLGLLLLLVPLVAGRPAVDEAPVKFSLDTIADDEAVGKSAGFDVNGRIQSGMVMTGGR